MRRFQGGTATITADHLSAAESGVAPALLTFTVSHVLGGKILVDGKEGAQWAFTQADIDSGRVHFVHDGKWHHSRSSFDFTVSDGVSAMAVSQRFFLHITDWIEWQEHVELDLEGAQDNGDDLNVAGQNAGGSSGLDTVDPMLPLDKQDDSAADAAGAGPGGAVPQVRAPSLGPSLASIA